MSPCSPTDNSLSPPIVIPSPIPGFGNPIAPVNLPFPDFAYPAGMPEDLQELVNSLGLLFPSGLYKPNLDNFSKNILDAVVSLLNQVAPYLSLYKFFLAALDIILCIIDVICSLLNPFKLRRAVRRLFKRCLPNFLALFPWLALIAMILALLLLLLALIEYLIATIAAYIEEIIRNLKLLGEAVGILDGERQLAAARKIASLLCLIQNLFAILIAFGAILSIIQELAGVEGRFVCQTGSASDDLECCDDEVCPPFIRNNPDGMTGIFGNLIYYSQLDYDMFTLFPTLPNGTLNLGAFRPESWQFVNPVTGQVYKISDIITPINGNIFWPDGLIFDANSSQKKIPYFLDLRIFLNPNVFPNTSADTKGARFFRINNCVITEKPYIGVVNFDNTFSSTPDTGTVHIVGGQVFEDDGTTPVLINGTQASLTNFIHQTPGFAPTNGPLIVNDGYSINNISYTLRFNFEALLSYTLITVGCLPDIAVEREIVNAQFADVSSVISKIKLPSISGVDGVVVCLQNALAKFRKNVSVDAAAIFQADVQSCLGVLKQQTSDAYKTGFGAAFNPFTSEITLNPEIQFIDLPIDVKVVLKDTTGTPITFNIPADTASEFANKLSANQTFGDLSPFVYDGSQAFIAKITSKKPGNGTITVSYDNKILSKIINRNNDNVPSSIVIDELPYTFVGSAVSPDAQPAQRRDEGDVARDNES